MRDRDPAARFWAAVAAVRRPPRQDAGRARHAPQSRYVTPLTGTCAVVSERYVTAGELAALMAVSVRTVKRWTAEGMPSETWGLRTRRYLPSLAVAWARDRGERHTMRDDNDQWPRRLTSATATHREE